MKFFSSRWKTEIITQVYSLQNETGGNIVTMPF